MGSQQRVGSHYKARIPDLLEHTIFHPRRQGPAPSGIKVPLMLVVECRFDDWSPGADPAPATSDFARSGTKDVSLREALLTDFAEQEAVPLANGLSLPARKSCAGFSTGLTAFQRC